MAFDQRMRELGYIEGQNLAFEFIHTADRVDRMSEAIQDLVRRKVDVIVESSGHELGLKAAVAVTHATDRHDRNAVRSDRAWSCRQPGPAD